MYEDNDTPSVESSRSPLYEYRAYQVIYHFTSLQGSPLRATQLHFHRHISTTRCRINMKVSVLKRGDQDLSIEGSISLKYQLYLYRSGKVRGWFLNNKLRINRRLASKNRNQILLRWYQENKRHNNHHDTTHSSLPTVGTRQYSQFRERGVQEMKTIRVPAEPSRQHTLYFKNVH
jgi:hypothetical protein